MIHSLLLDELLQYGIHYLLSLNVQKFQLDKS